MKTFTQAIAVILVSMLVGVQASAGHESTPGKDGALHLCENDNASVSYIGRRSVLIRREHGWGESFEFHKQITKCFPDYMADMEAGEGWTWQAGTKPTPEQFLEADGIAVAVVYCFYDMNKPAVKNYEWEMGFEHIKTPPTKADIDAGRKEAFDKYGEHGVIGYDRHIDKCIEGLVSEGWYKKKMAEG